MSDQPAAGSDRYIEGLLRAALAPAGAAGHPMAGRIVVRLLAAASASGSHDAIAECLAPAPGLPATFEVRSTRPGASGPPSLATGLTAATALREALLVTRGDADRVDVVGQTAAGLERRVLTRESDGGLIFLFPASDHYQGPGEAVREALAQWDRALAARRGALTADDIVLAVQSSLVEMTVDVNLAEMESLIRKTIEDAMATSQSYPAASQTTPVPVGPADADPLAAEALAERVAVRVSEQVVRMVAAAREADARTPEPVEPAAGQPAQEPVIEAPVLTRILGAVEALEVQMTALRDQGRMSSGAVRALTDQMARDARRSDVAAQHLVDVITGELDRLARRLEDRQAKLAVPPDL